MLSNNNCATEYASLLDW